MADDQKKTTRYMVPSKTHDVTARAAMRASPAMTRRVLRSSATAPATPEAGAPAADDEPASAVDLAP